MDFWYRPFGVKALALAPASLAYGLVTRAWHLAFDLGLRKATRVEGAHVISVGNLVVGGAGKTPVVIHLANEATKRGHRVAVLSRGYGRRSTELVTFDSTTLASLDDAGDEPRLIARRCPGVKLYVGADRVAAAQRAVKDGATLIILDDGFQHRRLARELDVLVDAGDDNGWVLPAGPLREWSSGRSRATHIWGRDGAKGDVEARHLVTHVRDADGTTQPIEVLKGRAVVLLLGVARPERVEAKLRELGAEVVRTHAYADHHVFTAAELLAAQPPPGALLVTTEKDAERLPPHSGAWVLVMNVEVTSGELPLPKSNKVASGL